MKFKNKEINWKRTYTLIPIMVPVLVGLTPIIALQTILRDENRIKMEDLLEIWFIGK